MIQKNSVATKLKPTVVAGASEAEIIARLRSLAMEGVSIDDGSALRLCLVADSSEQLATLATRAADRLERRPGKQIQDVSGIYFYPEPLGRTGSVAWLFPGEGSQYLGMLEGLVDQWPESRQVLEDCDRFAAEIGGEFRGLNYFVSEWQADSTEEEASARLRRIDNAMLSVLSAGWCLAEIARSLGIPMHATAGHSAGELAALMGSGAMEAVAELPLLAEAMNKMESKSSGGTAELLAVAAPATEVEEVVRIALEQAGFKDQAMVAMDNCPHQCIVVGQRQAVTSLSKPLQEKGWIVEALVLEQPYHTPMFAPLMGPLREAFDRVSFCTPSVPVYSCASGMRFPEDGDQIRELSLAHWQNRVRFQELIRNMYDDGVRVFLEVGPRGNISSFVADILRGQPHATIPMDTPRRTTAEQIVHAVAQLVAHHVPVNLERLEAENRTAQSVRSELRSAERKGSAGQVLAEHMQLMEELLSNQSQVMQQYLSGPRHQRATVNKRRIRRSGGRMKPAIGSELESPIQPAESTNELPHPELPLLGEVVSFEHGNHLIMEKLLDPAIEHYATHHTVGGREVSAIKPEQCGLPVAPMTFTLEMMMEAAIQLSPHSVVRSIGRVQLSRWLALYDRDPITIRIEAKRLESEDDTIRVLVRILDLGNREEPFGEKPKLAAVGTVELASDYAEPPARRELELTDARQCATSLKTMYNNLFHGNLFQGVRSLGRIGNEGIESKIEVLPRGKLFADNRSADFLGDPVLLDVAMHPNAAWHLEQPDQTGRIMLPFEVKSVEFFGPRPSVGDTFTCSGYLDEQSPRHFTHSVETVTGNGRVWNRINGVRLWRFYLPFHEVNFHGPKNVYHLSEEFLIRGDSEIATARFKWLDDLAQPTLLRAAAEVLLSEEEYEHYLCMSESHDDRVRWMFGSVVAKDAVRRWWYKQHSQRLYMSDIVIRQSGKDWVASPRVSANPSDSDLPPADAAFPSIRVVHEGKMSIAIAGASELAAVDLSKYFVETSN